MKKKFSTVVLKAPGYQFGQVPEAPPPPYVPRDLASINPIRADIMIHKCRTCGKRHSRDTGCRGGAK